MSSWAGTASSAGFAAGAACGVGGAAAGEIISSDRQGSINREFPDEYRNKTVAEIKQAAKGKGKSARRAKKALKLLHDKRFRKRQ